MLTLKSHAWSAVSASSAFPEPWREDTFENALCECYSCSPSSFLLTQFNAHLMIGDLFSFINDGNCLLMCTEYIKVCFSRKNKMSHLGFAGKLYKLQFEGFAYSSFTEPKAPEKQ